MPDLGFIEFEFQTVKYEHVSSLTFALVFRFQVFSSLSLAEFELCGLKLVEFSNFEYIV